MLHNLTYKWLLAFPCQGLLLRWQPFLTQPTHFRIIFYENEIKLTTLFSSKLCQPFCKLQCSYKNSKSSHAYEKRTVAFPNLCFWMVCADVTTPVGCADLFGGQNQIKVVSFGHVLKLIWFKLSKLLSAMFVVVVVLEMWLISLGFQLTELSFPSLNFPGETLFTSILLLMLWPTKLWAPCFSPGWSLLCKLAFTMQKNSR